MIMNTKWTEPTEEMLAEQITTLNSELFYYRNIIETLIIYTGNTELKEKFAEYLKIEMDNCKESAMNNDIDLENESSVNIIKGIRKKYNFHKNLLDQI